MAKKKEVQEIADPIVEILVQELAEVNEKGEALAARKKELIAKLTARIVPGTYLVKDAEVQVKPGSRTLDGAALEKAYPREKNPELYETETKLSTPKVREHLAPAELTKFLKEPGASSVVIK